MVVVVDPLFDYRALRIGLPAHWNDWVVPTYGLPTYLEPSMGLALEVGGSFKFTCVLSRKLRRAAAAHVSTVPESTLGSSS